MCARKIKKFLVSQPQGFNTQQQKILSQKLGRKYDSAMDVRRVAGGKLEVSVEAASGSKMKSALGMVMDRVSNTTGGADIKLLRGYRSVHEELSAKPTSISKDTSAMPRPGIGLSPSADSAAPATPVVPSLSKQFQPFANPDGLAINQRHHVNQLGVENLSGRFRAPVPGAVSEAGPEIRPVGQQPVPGNGQTMSDIPEAAINYQMPPTVPSQPYGAPVASEIIPNTNAVPIVEPILPQPTSGQALADQQGIDAPDQGGTGIQSADSTQI